MSRNERERTTNEELSVFDDKTVLTPFTSPFTSADRVRLLVTETPGDLTRIWELELYCLPKSDRKPE